MSKAELTYDLAMAAATDAANKRMKEGGRDRWNLQDAELASKVFNELWPLQPKEEGEQS